MSLERNSTSLSRALELSWPPDSGTFVVMWPSPPAEVFCEEMYRV